MLCKLFFGEIFFFCTEIVYGEKIFFYMSKGSLRSRRRGEGACKRRNRGEAFRPAAVSALLSAALSISVSFLLIPYTLYNSLCQHRVYDLLEACDVRAYHVVLREAVALCGIRHIVADVDHDALKLRVYLLEGPA